MTGNQSVVRMKTPAYDTNDYPKPPWGARIDLPLSGYGTDRAFYAGRWKGDPGQEGVLSIQAEEGDFVQYGHAHKDGREKSSRSGIHRVVANDKGQLVMGEEVDSKTVSKELRERHLAAKSAGEIPERDKSRAAGYAAWLMREYDVPAEAVAAAQKKHEDREAKKAERAAADQKTAPAAEDDGIPSVDF